MSKKWVGVIPAGDQVIATVADLKKRGYKVFCIDENPKAPGFGVCDMSVVAPINDYERILYILKSADIEPECFIPIVSDKAVLPAFILNRVFEANTANKNILAFYSKSTLRYTLQKSHLPGPKFTVLEKKDQPLKFKSKTGIIVKPDDSSGSRGISIIKAVTPASLDAAYDFAFKYSANKKVIAEEYVSGEEYMVDTFVYNKRVEALIVSQKKKIEDKVSYLIYSLNHREFPYKKLQVYIQTLCKTLNYTNGPMHVEIKYVKGEFYVLDLAVRGGGFGVYNYYVHKITGFSFVKSTIDVFLGKKLSQKTKFHKEGIIYFVTPPKAGVLKEIKSLYKPGKNEDVRVDIYGTKGQKLTMDVTDGNRLAGIYCFADTKDNLNALLERVKRSIKIIYEHES